jgi:glycine oxidase
VVIDPRGPGQGATRASAGVLAPYIEGHLEPLRRLAACSLALYDSFVRRVSSDGRQPVEYERAGTFQVARDDEEARDLHQTARDLAAAQVPHTLFDGASAHRIEPALADTITSALLIPGHGYVAAAALMSALTRAASSRGVTFTQAVVQRIEDRDAGARIATTQETFDSDVVVVAAGSWSGRLAMDGRAPVRPIRGQLVHLRLEHRVVSRVIWGSRCYVVPWQDGSLLIGATMEDVGFDETPTAAGVRELLEGGCELLPASAGAQFHEVRVGLRPATSDELPVIGASSRMPGVFYATGHFRNGVLLAPLTAKLIVDLVLDDRRTQELELTRPDRFGL